MKPIDKTAPSQTESISFEFDLHHSPEKVWRALTDPVLLTEWLLPVVDLRLEPGAAFTFKTQPYPGWDGTVNCRILEIETQKKLSYEWVVGDMEINTVVTFTSTLSSFRMRPISRVASQLPKRAWGRRAPRAARPVTLEPMTRSALSSRIGSIARMKSPSRT